MLSEFSRYWLASSLGLFLGIVLIVGVFRQLVRLTSRGKILTIWGCIFYSLLFAIGAVTVTYCGAGLIYRVVFGSLAH